MNVKTRDLEPLGFQGNGMFPSTWHHFYYCELPKKKAIYVLDALELVVSCFMLTNEEWRRFKKGTLALVPPGCCCATGHDYLDNPTIVFKGDPAKVFRTKKKFLEFLKDLVK
jgi:hypothetical protein